MENLYPQFARRIKEKYTSIKSGGDFHEVWLDIGVQHFCVAKDRNKEEAEWFRDQLSSAIEALIHDETGSERTP